MPVHIYTQYIHYTEPPHPVLNDNPYQVTVCYYSHLHFVVGSPTKLSSITLRAVHQHQLVHIDYILQDYHCMYFCGE